mmetsp:Transcript_3057/g.8300  ORF Transcript_3057/g.8300 Transcript_3057/m.8300 type:complete len:227 (-) Transcript_3057:61-741(-)|eukprot:CAMPEP_0197183104 /NCGR_PEP_ID=MMETSP1423-20130617/7437_1 /TAXON_ID=476441 /ORGANISM="Pseudo-nitzschia heimii, Strain UNC1101" /LENGTH=226 /DNA_ID=CAMNT_0042633643 /DNA_START=94 /DNA_END=777 /DNA_ORIENTATION=+
MKIKVYYYDFKFWRAEVIRCGLFLQNIPFEDIRDKEKLKEVTPKSPFRAFPIVDIDGTIVSQSQAIASYIGKLGSVFDYEAAGLNKADAPYPRMYPADGDYMGMAKCDEIINGVTDVSSTVGSTFGLPKDEVEPKRTALIQKDGGRLYMHCSGLDSLLCAGAPGVACGKTLTVADLCVWMLVSWLNKGVLDHIPTDFVSSNFPNLQAVYDACEENESIAEYVKQYH